MVRLTVAGPVQTVPGTLPEDASTGEAPHSAAKPASWYALGVVPAATSRIAATSDPTPRAPQGRVGPSGEGVELRLELDHLRGQRW